MPTPSRIVVVGASAGGLEPLKRSMNGLPANFPGAVLVVLHIPAQAPSLLASILDRNGRLPAASAVDGQRIEAGNVYVAVPDRHLLVDGEHIHLSRGPKENLFRPAIDALFRSAACTNGDRVIGVVLSGQLDDGTSDHEHRHWCRCRAGRQASRALDAIHLSRMSDEGSDAGLWSLLRAYQEQSMLLRHWARAATNDPAEVSELERRAVECDRRIDVLHALLRHQNDSSGKRATGILDRSSSR